jgi:hypothetical protein
MNVRLQGEGLPDMLGDNMQSRERPGESTEEDRSLLAEDPLTGLPWTETLLPLITNWAGSSAIHAICLHFVGLGILANIPELQSSHSLLHEATERLAPLMEDHDRLTRFSGNKLLIFSKRSEADIRGFLIDVSDRLESFGVEAEGRHLPEIRIGMATLHAAGHTAVTMDAVNSLMTDAVNVTIPLSEVVAPRHHQAAAPDPGAATPTPEPRPDNPVSPDVHAAPEALQPTTAMEQAQPVNPLVTLPVPAAATNGPAVRLSSDRKDSPVPHVSHPDTTETEEETTMITRGHLERTPIRHASEAPAPPADSPPLLLHHRLVLKGVDVVITGLVATAVVDLDFEGQKVRGKAIGRSSNSQHVGLIAEALGRAVTDLLPAGHGVVFKQAVPTSTDAGDVVVTVVELLTPERAEVLFGVAPTESEPVAGVARSVLNAVNHSIAHLLAPVE